MVQSDQLTTNIPNHLSNSTATGQQDESYYQDDREEELYQVDGTMDVQTLTDNTDDNEDNEPDNNACKTKRKTYAPADTVRKEMTKQRQADLLKKQQEKEKAKAQAKVSKDKPDNANRPRPHRSKGKASHPDQIKSSKKGTKTPRTHNDKRLPNDTQSDDEDILIGDEDIVPDDAEDPLGPDKIGFYTFFLEGKGNLPDLMGVDNMTNIHKQIDQVSTLGNMLGQDKQVQMHKFIETMPTIIQTHLIIESNWADITKKAKNLEHIIQKCDPPAISPPILQGAGAVLSLYSHIAQSQHQDFDNIPKPFKSTKGRGGKKSGKGKQKSQQQPQPPPSSRRRGTL